MSKDKHDGTHLTLDQRVVIQKGLDNGDSFAAIAKRVGKDPTTISKEVRRHITKRVHKELNRDIPCMYRKICKVTNLCNDFSCSAYCKMCSRNPGFHCSKVCADYTPLACEKLKKAPYVCNGCKKQTGCVLERSYYSAKYADDVYRDILVSSREGINQSPVDIALLDGLISPLLKKGQSLAHIYANHAAEIPCCRKTLYNYIDKSVFSARNLDLRRRVRYKVRKKATHVSVLAREFRVGRTYDDFQNLLKEKPDIPVIEMDTVEGKKGDSKALLTLLFRNCSLMLIILIPEKTQECVIAALDRLTALLGIEVFQELFPVILTDNGTEFQYPARMECDEYGEIRTKIFFCNPHSAWQKGMIEKNHEFIRLVIPKGSTLDIYTQADMTLLMNHINSEARDSLNGCTPFKLSQLLLNVKLHQVLHLEEIAPDEVTLCPELLKK